jgi:hypothetical protein
MLNLRHVLVKLDKMAAVLPPRSLPTKRLFFLLCQDCHNAIGLNRYAVLGRSSRLGPSVVPDQASLFAIFHA